MDRAQLARLYTTGEFADCTFISAGGQEFNAHRFILSQYPRLKALIDENNHIHLAESPEVTERLLRWMYGLENWKSNDVQPTRDGVGKELTEIMSVCDAAQKYGIPKLGDNTYSAVGQIIGHITSAEVGLHVIRDLTDQNTGAGALQRTIIDRVLSLLPRDVAGATTKKPKREDANASTMAVPGKPDRIKKPTAKAQQLPAEPLKKRRSSIKVYCVCEKPEDPFLVQCESCKRWFHPGCVGKGKYAESSYRHARKIALAGDEKMYREKNLGFTCTDCDDGAA